VLKAIPLEAGEFDGERFPYSSFRVRVTVMNFPDTTESAAVIRDWLRESVDGVTPIKFEVVERPPLVRVIVLD